MTFSLPTFSRRNTVLFTTLILILGAFGYYFLVHVKNNESRFIAGSYRALDRKAKNIENKHNGYKSYLDFVYSSVGDELTALLTSDKSRSREIENLNTQIQSLYSQAADMEVSAESKRKEGPKGEYQKISSVYDQIDRAERRIDRLTSNFDDKIKVKIKEVLEQASPENVRLDYFIAGDVNYERSGFFYDASDFSWQLEGTSDSSYVSFSMNAPSFVSSLLSNDFFDEFILLKEGVEYDNSGKLINFPVVYQTFDNPIDLQSISPFLQNRNGEKDFDEVVSLDSMYQLNGPKMVKPVDVSLFNGSYKLLFHRLEIEEQVYYLGGFVKKSVFKKESQKVEVFMLVLAILIILVLLISMPILKLVFMSPIERLHISNVVMAGGSIILGVPIVLLIVFSVHDFVVRGSDESTTNLELLSAKIENSFELEIETILRSLDGFDQQLSQDSRNFDSLDFSSYNEFNQVFWADQKGYPVKQHSLLNIESSGVNLSKRDYFRRIIEDDMWTFNASSNQEKPDTVYKFYLQSIVSWSDFTNEAAISIPSRLANSDSRDTGYPVAVVTSQLRSVMNPILPMGYGFAIIDENGLVKFHSNSERILQENFLDETNNSADIRTSIFSRIAVTANVKYRNVNHKVHVQPINAMPLYLVTFYNNEYRNAEVQGIITLSIILLFGTFGAVGLMILMLHLMQKRRSKLKIKIFVLHWIKPDDIKTIEYQFLSLLFLLIGGAILLMISNDKIHVQDILFTLVITNAYLFLISYTWLTSRRRVNYTERASDKINFNIAFIIFIVGADFAYLQISDGSQWWILYQLLLTLIVLFSQYLEELIVKGHAKLPSNDFLSSILKRHSYNIFLFTWLLISSILPIFYIFMVAHNEEKLIWEKFNQLEIAQNYQEKVKVLDSRVKLVKNENGSREAFFEAKIDSGLYLLSNELSLEKSKGFVVCANGNSEADKILSKIRPHYSDLIVKSKGLAFDVSDELNRQWCFPEGSERAKIQLSFKDNFGPQDRGARANIYVNGNLDLLSFGLGYHAKPGKSSYLQMLFLVGIVIILAALYSLIDYCINKIYGREYSAFKNTLPLMVENFKKISIGADSITHHKQSQILLLGLPKSNKSNLLKELEGNLLKIDMIHMNHASEWKEITEKDLSPYDGVVLENFEYGVSSHAANVMRLNLLEKLTLEGVHQLVISSNVHPSFITNFYEGKLSGEGENSKIKEEFVHALETWRHILGGFIIVHNPIRENSKVNRFLRSKWVETEAFQQLFIQELNKGSFLPNLIPAIKDYFVKMKKNSEGDEKKIDKEDVILRIQLLAESYYLGLWNTLSKEEKYIIYDLAKDRFVNINNKNGIRSLLEKGLLVYDNELRIMNESFTNFVLSVIKKGEALRMEKEVRDKGTWSTISSVLGLAVLGMVAFLFLGNPDFFQDFNALIGVFAAIVGILPRLSGMFGSGNGKDGAEANASSS